MKPLDIRPSNSSSRSFTPIAALTTGLALSVLVRIANEWGDEFVLTLSASVLCLLLLIAGGLEAVASQPPTPSSWRSGRLPFLHSSPFVSQGHLRSELSRDVN